MLPYSHVIIMIVVEWTVVVSHGLQNVLYYSSLLYCYFAVHHCFCLFVFSFSLVHFQFMMSFKDFLIKILYLVSCIHHAKHGEERHHLKTENLLYQNQSHRVYHKS